MSGYWNAPDDYAMPEYIGGNGSAHSVSNGDEEYDAAEQVRLIAEEVTGKKMPRPIKPKIGFL